MKEKGTKRYRKVDPNIWNDWRFNQLDDDGKLGFLFLLTHPNMTSIGAMRGSLSGLSCELGWLPERLPESLTLMLSEGSIIFNEKASLIYLPNALKYNAPESPNVVKSWNNVFDRLPECSEKIIIFQSLKDFTKGLNKAFAEAFAEAFPKDYTESRNKEQGARSKEQNSVITNTIPTPPPAEILDEKTGEIIKIKSGMVVR